MRNNGPPINQSNYSITVVNSKYESIHLNYLPVHQKHHHYQYR